MKSLRARVHNGRLLLDEPTALPEGETVELLPVGELAESDDLDADERDRLHEALAQGLSQGAAGRTVPGSTVLERLRARGSKP